MDTPDPVLADIRKLREGRGLTAGMITVIAAGGRCVDQAAR